MGWTDVHAHLYDYAGDVLETLVSEAKTAGVEAVVNTAISIDTARTVINQCKQYPQSLVAAVGVSPFDANGAIGGWDNELKNLVTDPIVAAIGEIGLDGVNPAYPSLDIQMPIFTKQLEIAIDADITAIIHSRGMEKKTAEICRDIGVKESHAIFHCFTGDAAALNYIMECGYYISISGNITYKNSHLREIVKLILPNKLLIETDCPYLSPVPHRGKQNRPAFLIHTAKEIARLLEVDEADLAESLKKNVTTALKNIYLH